MMNRSVAVIFLISTLLFCMVVLQACVSSSENGSYDLPTPIPPYVATDQASAIQARATRQASEGKLVELAAESTVVVMRMTASVATETAVYRQTEVVQAATSTAAQQAVETTATAQSAMHTAVAINAASTATQAAYYVEGTSTAIVLGLMQASATAETERIAEQRESERQTALFRTWAWRVAIVILFALGVFITWQSVSWVLLRVFGIHRFTNRPIVITPDGKGGFNIFDISRSIQPGASVSTDGHILTAGGTKSEEMQSQAAARAQAAELLLAANSNQGMQNTQRRAVMRQAMQAGRSAPILPTGETRDVEVVVVPPDDPRVRPLLDEVEPKLLNGGEGYE